MTFKHISNYKSPLRLIQCQSFQLHLIEMATLLPPCFLEAVTSFWPHAQFWNWCRVKAAFSVGISNSQWPHWHLATLWSGVGHTLDSAVRAHPAKGVVKSRKRSAQRLLVSWCRQHFVVSRGELLPCGNSGPLTRGKLAAATELRYASDFPGSKGSRHR